MHCVATRHNILSGNIHELVAQRLLHVVKYFVFYFLNFIISMQF